MNSRAIEFRVYNLTLKQWSEAHRFNLLGQPRFENKGENWRENKPGLVSRHVVMDAVKEIMHDYEPLAAHEGLSYVEQKAMQRIFEEGPNKKTKSHYPKSKRD